jgi:ATP-dependent Clp protease ATP-binding subunit ClpB
VDFKNTIIIMTSNLGSDIILNSEDPGEMQSKIDVMLKSTFKPEFLNRVDEIITFNRLGEEQIHGIVEIQLKGFQKRLAAKKLTIRLDEDAIQFLTEVGFDPAFGARPLKRTIQHHIQDPLAKKLLEGELKEGDSVLIKRGVDGLDFQRMK